MSSANMNRNEGSSAAEEAAMPPKTAVAKSGSITKVVGKRYRLYTAALFCFIKKGRIGKYFKIPVAQLQQVVFNVRL